MQRRTQAKEDLNRANIGLASQSRCFGAVQKMPQDCTAHSVDEFIHVIENITVYSGKP